MSSLMQLGNSQIFDEDAIGSEILDYSQTPLPSLETASLCSLMGSLPSFTIPEGAESSSVANPKDFVIDRDREDPMWNSVEMRSAERLNDSTKKPSNPIPITGCSSPARVSYQFDEENLFINRGNWTKGSFTHKLLDYHQESVDGQKQSLKITNCRHSKREKRTKHSSIEENPSPSQTPPNSSNFHQFVDYFKRFSSSAPKGVGRENDKEKMPRYTANEFRKTFSGGTYRNRSLSVGGVPGSTRKPDVTCQDIYSIYDDILKEGNYSTLSDQFLLFKLNLSLIISALFGTQVRIQCFSTF